MKEKKRLLAIAAVLFTILMAYLAYDMGRHTTTRGSKKHLPESIKHGGDPGFSSQPPQR